ncbi:MAG: ABC transporter ATP-binding protein [Sedimentibacter sp.]|uniref:ABC transporter ATP-binding protein n=1 Tax=Sedimentibacter sp. TaxID=1960295 RepID=UPI0031594D05
MKSESPQKPSSFIGSSYIQFFLKKYLINYILGIMALLVVDYVQTRVPIIVGNIIDRIELGKMDTVYVQSSIVKLFAIAGTIYVGRILWRYFIFGTSRSIERDMRNDMFSHLEQLSAVFYHQHGTGEIMAYMTNDLEAVRMALGPGILTLCDVIALGSITVFNMVTEIDPLLTVAAVIPLLLIAVSVRFMGRELQSRFTKKQEAFAQLSNFVQESLSGIKVIKSFVQEDKSNSSFEKQNKDAFKKNIDLSVIQTLMHPFMQMISGAALAVAIGYGGYITIKGRITLGEFSAFIQYLGMLVWPMMATGMTINLFNTGAASLERVEKILKEPVEIKDSENRSVESLTGSIQVKNLSYRYPGTDKYVLRDIDFSVEKGQTLGIIGRTGSGKTTLVNLMLRIFEPDKNTIYIGGFRISDIPLKVLRKTIGYVPQDNFLFSDTIANNIDFGLRSGQMDKIEQAARDAVIHDNIAEFKNGYDTLVGEKGVSVSGGQKQRISIARALIKDPEILILDDSVSAVDTDTEEKILNTLEERRKGKTNIIIAHRISTIQNADIIIVLDEGRIVEKGTHQQLIQQDGLYCSIYEKQLLEKMLEEQE